MDATSKAIIKPGRWQGTAAAIAGDLVGAFLPGSGIAAKAVEAVLARRDERAREIFLSELTDGLRIAAEKPEGLDEFASITINYIEAARAGSARANLRLLARIVNGQAGVGRLEAADFLSWSSIISSLRSAEIHLLAALKRLGAPHPPQGGFCAEDVITALHPPGSMDKEEAFAYLNALTRTGLVGVQSALDGNVFMGTALLHQLIELASLEGLDQ